MPRLFSDDNISDDHISDGRISERHISDKRVKSTLFPTPIKKTLFPTPVKYTVLVTEQPQSRGAGGGSPLTNPWRFDLHSSRGQGAAAPC